jgi:hypothetical protein
MGKFVDLTGKRFGKFVIIKRGENHIQPSGKIEIVWLCRCDCGKEFNVNASHLYNNHTRSCGCLHEVANYKKIINLENKRFGKLVVIRRAKDYIQPSGKKRIQWECVCDCGNTIIIRGTSLIDNNTRSCGCINESFIAFELKKYCIKKHKAKTEYKILKNLNTGRWLPYDIYIPNGNNPKINGAYIEVNGKHHYQINGLHKMKAKKNGTTTDIELQKQKTLDKEKRKFAKNNGIYIEIDLREIKTKKQAITYVENILKLEGEQND